MRTFPSRQFTIKRKLILLLCFAVATGALALQIRSRTTLDKVVWTVRDNRRLNPGADNAEWSSFKLFAISRNGGILIEVRTTTVVCKSDGIIDQILSGTGHSMTPTGSVI